MQCKYTVAISYHYKTLGNFMKKIQLLVSALAIHSSSAAEQRPGLPASAPSTFSLTVAGLSKISDSVDFTTYPFATKEDALTEIEKVDLEDRHKEDILTYVNSMYHYDVVKALVALSFSKKDKVKSMDAPFVLKYLTKKNFKATTHAAISQFLTQQQSEIKAVNSTSVDAIDINLTIKSFKTITEEHPTFAQLK